MKFWRRAPREEMGTLGSSGCEDGPLGRQVREGDLGWIAVCHTVLSFEYIFFYVGHILFSQFLIFQLHLAALGLPCCSWAFSSCGEQGLLFVAECGLHVAAASLAVERGLQGSRASVVVECRFSCSAACGIFPDQESNLGLLHWQADLFFFFFKLLLNFY